MDRVQRAEALADFAVAAPEDVERVHAAVERARKRASGMTADDPEHAHAWFVVGTGLRILHAASDDTAHLDEAYAALRRAFRESDEADPDLAHYLTEFAVVICHRAEAGGTADLGEAEKQARRAVELTPVGHPQRPGRLSMLATVLRFRTVELRPPDTQRLGEALEVHREALETAVRGDPGLSRYLRSQAQTLLIQAQVEGDHKRAAEAERSCYRAMRLAHPYDPLQRLLLETAQHAQAVRGILL